MPTEFVIAGRRSPGCLPSIWNFYPDRDAAETALASGTTKFAQEYPAGAFVMKWGDFEKLQREFWVNSPLLEITERQWWDALEVLPPLKWHTEDGVEKFLMSEFTTGNFTAQYAALNDRYFVKTVDAFDKASWIDRKMIEKFLEFEQTSGWDDGWTAPSLDEEG